MRFSQYLHEEYITMFTGKHFGDTKGTVLCNPDSKELRSLEETYVRFIIDKHNKKIYVWRVGIVHYEAAKQLKKLNLISVDNLDAEKFWKLYYAGVGYIKGNKIRWTHDSDYALDFDSNIIDSVEDLEWTHKWVIWGE